MPGRRSYRLSGVDRYLAPTEHILYICRRHWIVVAQPIFIWAMAILVAAAIGFIFSPDSSGTVADRIAGWGALLITIYSVWKVAHWWIARYAVTDQRVLLVEGLITRSVSAIPLSKVTDTTFRRSILGRLLGYGDLMLDSPGEKPGLSVLTELPKPDELYRLIMSLVVKKEEPTIAPPEPAPRFREPDEDETGPIPRVRA